MSEGMGSDGMVREGYKEAQLGPKTLEVPKEWDFVYFDEAVEVNPRYNRPDEGTFDFVPMDAVDEGKQVIEYWNQREKEDCTGTWFKNGDTIYAKITPCAENGKIAFVEGVKTELASGSTEFFVFHPKEEVTDPKFVYYLSNLPEFRAVTISLMEGSTARQRIPLDIFRGNLKVPLPPLPEQRRIAAILSTVDEEIHQTDVIIEAYQELRQGLMQDLLFEGIGNHEFQSVQAGPKEFQIPVEWELSTVEEITTRLRNGIAEKQNHDGVGIPVTRIETISDGFVDMDSIGWMDIDPEQHGDFLLEQGDILFSHKNSLEHLGKTAQFRSNETLYHGENLLLLRPDRNMVDPRFAYFFLNTETVRGICRSFAKKSVSQVSLNQQEVGALPVPIPPMEEQERIAEILTQAEIRIRREHEWKEEMTELKRGLTQDLLTGNVRTPPDLLSGEGDKDATANQ